MPFDRFKTLGERGFVDLEQPAGAGRLAGNVLDRQRFRGGGEGIPESRDRVEQDAVGQAALGAAMELVGRSAGGLHDQPQLDERTIERVFHQGRAALARRDVTAQETIDIALERAGRDLLAAEGLGPFVECGREGFAGELRLVEMAERPEPRRRPAAVRRDLPVEQPKRGRVFEVRVEAVVGEHEGAQLGRPQCRRAGARFFQDASCEAPVADGADHVLADAQRGDGVVALEDVAVGAHRVIALLQPRVTKRERLVP